MKASRSSSSDTTSQLMKLGQTESLRIFYNDDRCIRHIDTYFYHYCSDQYIDLSPIKGCHDLIFFSLLHRTMYQCCFVI